MLFSVSDHHLLCFINQVSDRLSVCDFVNDTDSINNYNPGRDVYGMCPLAPLLAYAIIMVVYIIYSCQDKPSREVTNIDRSSFELFLKN